MLGKNQNNDGTKLVLATDYKLHLNWFIILYTIHLSFKETIPAVPRQSINIIHINVNWQILGLPTNKSRRRTKSFVYFRYIMWYYRKLSPQLRMKEKSMSRFFDNTHNFIYDIGRYIYIYISWTLFRVIFLLKYNIYPLYIYIYV